MSGRLLFASDHAGVALRRALFEAAVGWGLSAEDCGPKSEGRVDYPDFAATVCERVVSSDADRGVLVCGSGIGMAIAANRFRGVRAVNAAHELQAELSRRHNNANVLCLGARLVGPDLALAIMRRFLDTQFEGGRHAARVDKLDAL